LFFIYILRSSKTNRFYVGSTKNVELRFIQHNQGKSISTRAGVPWELIHTQAFPTRSEAIRQEQKIKARGIERYLSDLKQINSG
jgi:putative endonuclease